MTSKRDEIIDWDLLVLKRTTSLELRKHADGGAIARVRSDVLLVSLHKSQDHDGV